MTFDDWCAAHGAKELSMEDPFADLRGKRMSELTAEQTDRSNELWLREQIGPREDYWYPHLQALFRVIDRLRAQQAKPVQQGGWHDAAQWLRDNYQDHQTIAGLCDAMVAAAPVQPSAFDPTEALRLADRCESLSQIADAYSAEAYEQSAAELRRQHAEIERLKAQRDALRAALELYRGQVDQTGRHSAAEAIDRAVQALGARETKRDALRVVQPSAFDPVAAMRLADDYAFAQSELDGEHSTSRKYYVEGRDEARAALAAYLGIKEAK